MKKHIRKIGIVSLVVLLLAAAFAAGRTCVADGDPEKETLPVSAAEVANELIALEEKEKKANMEAVVTPAVQMPVKPPALFDKIFYIEGNVNLEKANFLKEVTISGIYGGEWSLWMHSTLLFHKTAYKAQEVSDRIQLLVYLRPTIERNDNNYITLNFDLYPPKGEEKRWSGAVSFDSRTQGRESFPLAYDVFVRDFEEQDIVNLSEQVLDIALVEVTD